jgi:hypothetical protein
MAEEIDAGECGRGAPAAGRFGVEGEDLSAGSLVRAEREVREDARRPRSCSSATRSFGRPSMARRQDFSSVAHVGAR